MRLAPKQPNVHYGILVTLLAYLCFAIAAALVRSFNPLFPTMQIIFIQNIVSLLCILPNFYHNRFKNFRVRLLPIHIVRDVAGVMSFFCYFFAIKKLNLIDATVLTYTAPFYTPIIWMLWTKEKMEKGIWWTIVLGFIGIAFILKPGQSLMQIGSLIGLTAGILSSIALVAIRVLNQKLECLSRTLFYYFFIGTLITMPFAIIEWNQPSVIQMIGLIAIGILMAGGQIFLTNAYCHGTASFLSPLSYSMIIFTGIISVLFFKQLFGWLSFIGTFFIILGGTISYIIKTKPKTFARFFEHPIDEKRHFWLRKMLSHKAKQEEEKQKKEEEKKESQ